MGNKRKARSAETAPAKPQSYQNHVNETFDDSEDEFYTHRDKILLDEAPAAKRRRGLEEEAELQHSDEEVLEDGFEEDDEDVEEDLPFEDDGDDSRDDDQVDREDGEDERVWGTSRRDYYNTDVIETEADALEEEAEARRLQQKQLKDMNEADFGFDQSEWAGAEKAADPGRTIVEKLPPVQIPQNATNEERWNILRARYPEFQPLTEDLLALKPKLEELSARLFKQQSALSSLDPNESPILIKVWALSAYMGSIAMYIGILVSPKDGLALPPSELRDHPIMATLLRCRQAWDQVKDLQESDHSDAPQLSGATPSISAAILSKAPVVKSQKQTDTLDFATAGPSDVLTRRTKQKQSLDVEDPYQQLPSSKPKERKQKQKRSDLRDILSQAAHATQDDGASDFGDEVPLTHEEAAEKAKKKKSLRFYTSQIAQKANKRGAASREAGGDDDIPHKERIKDKQARLMREAERIHNGEPSMEDEASDLDDRMLVDQINGDSNDYYNAIVSKSQQKKADKKARADAFAKAARQGSQVYEEEHVGPDGKRKITYAIAKNKGLTPKRKKEVRNPRVKKKLRYEQKMKKLSSIRPVYKGGEGKGGYGGELTGIKTNVVKSVKL